MAITDEQLQRYWDENPQVLEQAVASNPGMFGLSSQTSFNTGVPGAATQREPVGSGMMSSGMTLDQIRAQNQAYNAANPMPAGFTPPPAFNEQGFPLYQTGGGFGPVDSRAAPYSLNKLFANPSQDFNEYLTSGTAVQQEFRADNFNLGGVSLIRPDGRVTSTPSTFAPEVQQTVLQELNQQEQAYIDQLQNFFQGEGTMPTPPDPYSIFEKYGLPQETIGPDGGLLKLNPVTGQYEGGKKPEDSAFAQLVKQTPAIMGAIAGGPLAAGLGSGLSSATQGGNIGDVLKSAATGATLSSLGEFLAPGPSDPLSVTTNTASGAAANVAPNLAAQAPTSVGGLFDAATGALRAQNPVGSLARGSLTSAVGQAIMNGEISLEDALKGGLITLGVDTVTDVFGDVRQTNDDNLILGVDTLNGRTITDQKVLDRLTNTSDVYTLLGPEGILSQLTGLDVPYLNTTWAGNALDFVDDILGTGFGDRPVIDPGNKFRDEAVELTEEAGEWARNQFRGARSDYEQGLISPEEYLEINNFIRDNLNYTIEFAQNNFLRNTQRYDERFFDVFTPRGESPLVGIYENNPVANRGPIVTGTPGGSRGSGSPSGAGGAFGEGGPSAGGLPSAGAGTVFTDVRDDEDVEPAENIDEQEEAESLIEEDILGPGDVDTVGGISPDSPLQSTVDNDDDDKLSSGTGGTDDVQGTADDLVKGEGTADDLVKGEGTADDLVKGEGGAEDLVGSVDTVPSTVDAIPPGSGGSLPVEQFVAALASTLPGGGGGGGRRRGGLFDGGREQAKDFMANIEYIIPMLQQMNIPLEDFLVMWMNRE